MTRHVSIQIFTILFALSLLLSCALAYHASTHLRFAFALTPDAAARLAFRVQAVRAAGLAFALLLMLLVIVGRSRAARGALSLRWLLGLVTSYAFLRGTGLAAPLAEREVAVVTASAFQLCLEACALVVLYGEDAAAFFGSRRALFDGNERLDRGTGQDIGLRRDDMSHRPRERTAGVAD
jgi:hypothetical protein